MTTQQSDTYSNCLEEESCVSYSELDSSSKLTRDK